MPLTRQPVILPAGHRPRHRRRRVVVHGVPAGLRGGLLQPFEEGFPPPDVLVRVAFRRGFQVPDALKRPAQRELLRRESLPATASSLPAHRIFCIFGRKARRWFWRASLTDIRPTPRSRRVGAFRDGGEYRAMGGFG